MRKYTGFFAIVFLLLFTVGGCTIHPQGEEDERRAALQAGKVFDKPARERIAPQLPANPTADDLVTYALLTNADLERQYWDWRSAIEQIPQDGTQPTNLAFSGGTTISKRTVSRDRTTLAAFNDPMADIIWPEKISVAAKRALENARAAGLRFRKAKFDLRNKVIKAYCDYALTAELARLESENVELLQTTAMIVEARNGVGTAGQRDLLKARNELDLARNDLANMKSQLPAQRAALTALLNTDAGSSLPVPAQLPSIRAIDYSDEQLLAMAAKQNPELGALAAQISGRSEGVRLARMQYLPDFSISASTDLAGIAQSLTGMVTVPLLRYQAINAAIAQAEANLKSADAMRRQTQNDLAAQVIMDISALRDTDRQLNLFDRTILPRGRQVVAVARTTYEVGQSTLLDLLDDQRSLNALSRLDANLRVAREKQLADLEAIAAVRFGGANENQEPDNGSSAI